jgi:hypothetical protein
MRLGVHTFDDVTVSVEGANEMTIYLEAVTHILKRAK